MIKTVSYTYDSTGATPDFTNEWRDFNVADYDNVAICIQSSTGWTGDITFWGAAGYLDAAPSTQAYLYSIHDASETDSTVFTNTLTNGSSNYGKTFVAPIGGLTRFGVFMADAVTYNAAIGFVEVAISFHRSQK